MTIEEWAEDFKSYVNELQMPRDDYKGIMEYIDDQTADINVRRGIEAIEKALGKKAEYSGYSRLTKELRHYGIEFRQFADDRTKTFVKAGCKPPKVVLVDEDDQEIQETK